MAKRRKQKRQKTVTNTGEIVLSALKKLARNTGWTAKTIVKFIKMEFSITDPKIGRKVSRALKRGVRLGLVQLEQGRYQLNNISGFAQRVSSAELRARTDRQARPCAWKPKRRPKQRALRIRSRAASPL